MRGPSDETLQGFLDAYHRNGCNLVKTSDQFGISRATLQHWEKLCVRRGLKPNVDVISAEEKAAIARLGERVKELELERDALQGKLQQATKPRFTVRQDQASGEQIRLVCIGDAHDSPAIPDKSRFEWMGAFINDRRPDVVVQIGDLLTLDSLNSHIPNENYDGRAKKTFREDIASGILALDALNSKIAYTPEKHVTLGNHERRLFLFEQSNPEAFGMMSADLDSALRGRGWSYSPYGAITYYGGVGFVHAALNVLGKTFGGKNAEMTIANETLTDLVIGHSHVERAHRARKIDHKHVTVLNVGCALPDGYIEDYAQHALTGWSWGVTELTIRDGHITDRDWVSMKRLEERYA
jgi:hypothetical protein